MLPTHFIRPVLLLLTLGVTFSVAADTASHLGPKGGDTRKGVLVNPERTYLQETTSLEQEESGVYARVERQWYISPKGSDSRRGVITTTITEGTVFSHPAVASERPASVGPKGGSIRRGF